MTAFCFIWLSNSREVQQGHSLSRKMLTSAPASLQQNAMAECVKQWYAFAELLRIGSPDPELSGGATVHVTDQLKKER